MHLTVRARATPNGCFGQITGIAGVVGQVANGLSMVWLGLALRFTHGTTTFIVLGAALFCLAACVLFSPAIPLPSVSEAE